MKLKLLIIFSGLMFLGLNNTANASSYAVYDTILTVYAQSTEESDANLMHSSEAIYNGGEHPWCGQRAYIDFSDKELYATALSVSITGKAVNFIYEDAAIGKFISGHVQTSCKVISIWW